METQMTPTEREMTMSNKTQMKFVYEATHMLNGKPAGFAGFFPSREAAESLRRHSQLAVRIKRVRIAQHGIEFLAAFHGELYT